MRRVAAVVVLLVLAFAISAKESDSYILRDGDITYMLGKGMPAEQLKVIQNRFGDHFLWARRGGKVYVATDAKTLADARAVLQRNVKRGPETSRRLGTVIDAAVKRGAARLVR